MNFTQTSILSYLLYNYISRMGKMNIGKTPGALSRVFVHRFRNLPPASLSGGFDERPVAGES